MTRATKSRKYQHARLFRTWLEMPSYQSLSFTARALLVEILAHSHPDDNGRHEWTSRQLAGWLGASPSTAARAFNELIKNGWVSIERMASFASKNKPGRYCLAMFDNEATGDPASMAFAYFGRDTSRVKSNAAIVSPVTLDSITSKTPQCHQRDTKRAKPEAVQVSERLKRSRLFNKMG